MAELETFSSIRSRMTGEELDRSIKATKKQMNKYKLITFILLLCGGIGLLLPFGKITQCWILGYRGISGKRNTDSTGALWAIMGFIGSLYMVFFSKFNRNLLAAKYIDASGN